MKSISKTAFYCCGIRMRDADGENPVCGDIYAGKFMDEEGLRIFETFHDETGPNASNIVRHRIIDDLLRRELETDPELTVVLIGAGFDSRAYRLGGGGTWIELDEPPVIAFKNERLPAEDCQNQLHRIPIDFSTNSLKKKLSPFANPGSSVTVVIEGVLLYLEKQEIEKMFQTLQLLFPQHKLICDLMNRKFFEKYGKTMHEKINDIGASFKFTEDDPEKIFLKNGYLLREKISIIERAVELGLMKIPVFILRTFLRTLSRGIGIYLFERH